MYSHICKCLILWTYLLLVPNVVGESYVDLASEDEARLLQNLFEHRGYNNLIRPVRKSNESVLVEFNMAMVQIIHLEEKSQVMKSNVWLRQQWNDYQLQWDPEDFGGIHVFRVHPSKIWSPELVLFNNADGNYKVSWMCNLLVNSDGTVMWVPPAIYLSSCTIEVQYFPFDQQTCELRFGSWTYDGTQVSLTWLEKKNFMDLGDYFPSGTWDIIECPGFIEHHNDTFHGSKPVEIVYKITLRRKTLFYTVNLIVPCVLISFLSVCVFYLPSDVGEKITLCISILLALVVFLLLISKILPPTSKSIPLISKYLLFTFIMNVVTIFVTVVIINWNFRTPRTHCMPPWVRVFFMQKLPKLLLMRLPDDVEAQDNIQKRLKEVNKEHQHANSNSGSEEGNLKHRNVKKKLRTPKREDKNVESEVDELAESIDLADHEGVITRHHPRCHESIPLQNRTSTVPKLDKKGQLEDVQINKEEDLSTDSNPIRQNHNGSNLSSNEHISKPIKFHGVEITAELREAIIAINFIASNIESDENYQQVLKDWKYVASVIDRLFLVLFGAITVLGTAGILMDTPFIYSSVIDIEDLKKMYTKSIS